MSTASAVPLLRDTDDEPRSGGRSINGGGAEADVVHSQHSNTTPASSSSTASRPSAAGFHAISIEDSEISSSTSSSNPNGKKPAGGVKAKKKERFGIGGAPPPADVPKSKKINFVRLLALSRPERGTLIWATVCLFLSSILNLALPAIVAVVIDAISTGSDADASRKESALYHALTAFGDAPRTILNVSTFLLLIIVIIANIFGCIRGYLFSLAGERIVARMRRDLFRKIVTFEVGFFDVTRTGELINRLSSDSTILKDAATTNISMGLRWMATVIIGIGYLFWCSWSLTLVMLSVVPPVAIGARYFGKKIRALSKSTQDALAEATTTAEESISAIRTIRSFGKEEYAGRMYAEKIEVTFQLGKSIALQYGLFIGLLGFLASLAMIIVLYYGSIIVLRGDLTTGALTAYVLYTLTVGMALGGLSGLFASFMQALGACERIFELLDREPSLGVDKRRPPVHGAASAGAGQGRIPSGRPRGEVVLKDVFFSYPSRPETQVLKGVNLTLQPGTTTALVGPSGHGKSTIVALIERFYDIDSETSGPPSNGLHGSSGSDLSRYAASGITIDGVDLRDLDLHWLHSNVGLISQEPILFATTIRENLLFGSGRANGEPGARDISEAEIIRACESANAWEFISTFKDGLDTMVGERGIRLSGGQKQRVVIARALLLNPLILIADEATSSLDSESEFKVQEALNRLMDSRTTLVIAHRLSTVQNASKVCVVHHGQIVEQGTHTELLAVNNLYARLVRRQLQQPVALNHEELAAAEPSSISMSSPSSALQLEDGDLM